MEVPQKAIRGLLLAAGLIASLTLVHALPRPFRSYTPGEGWASDAPLPPDYQNKTEFVLGRLMYTSGFRGGGRFGGSGGGGNWTIDYPRGDRTFAMAIRRLTRVDVRSVEQPVNPDDGDDIFYWPYLHVSMPTAWSFSDEQAKKIREYLMRGGFMVCDSFFGTEEWAGFERGIRQIFPDREIVDLADNEGIFHIAYDLKEKYQVGNYRALMRNGFAYRGDGSIPHWRAIRDDKGRVMVMMNFNHDLGDSWQLADNPEYPEKFSSLGIRLGVNYVVYSMTH